MNARLPVINIAGSGSYTYFPWPFLLNGRHPFGLFVRFSGSNRSVRAVLLFLTIPIYKRIRSSVQNGRGPHKPCCLGRLLNRWLSVGSFFPSLKRVLGILIVFYKIGFNFLVSKKLYGVIWCPNQTKKELLES